MKLLKTEAKFEFRLRLVKSAYAIGIKPTAKYFKTTARTVRKWLGRYEKSGVSGLKDQSKRPQYMPNKCSPEFEKRIIELRLNTRNKYGAVRLIERFGITEYGKSCIQRIVKDHGLKRQLKTRKKKRKYLWSTKKLYNAFEKIQVDVKVLTDISNYWPQFINNSKEYPRYEITARCVKTGATFIALMKRNDSINSATFMYVLGAHLKEHGFDLKKITIQTDNGAEFNACGKRRTGHTPFEAMVADYWGMNLNRIPPASPTFNSDVETFHRIVEDEFYCMEQFDSLEDMKKKVYTYMLDFNYLRKNRNKDNQTPWELLQKEYPKLSKNILNLPPVMIDDYQDKGMSALAQMHDFGKTGHTVYAPGVYHLSSSLNQQKISIYYFVHSWASKSYKHD